jgi:aspartyl-tRNA(Asn)/glutamyl-tRNA(Gln) amidotransferase subunit B
MTKPEDFEPVIGLEVHAELQTDSKMFCACPVVDSTLAAPNTAVCPVCAGLPGTLPVVNERAVDFAIRVALALRCEVQRTSIFARKNYFYPDLPKGYQISQYEDPLAINGRLTIRTSAGEQVVRVRRVHLEEDTGKLTHLEADGKSYSLVDLNRAGVPLLEVVSEPDMHSPEEARAYGEALRDVLRYLHVNSGDMEKGVIRFEANVSVRPRAQAGEEPAPLGIRTEVKNLNSFRSLERSIAYEIERQSAILAAGGKIQQETLGWSDARGETYSQRSKEEAHDYRYFPEPDLPPLLVEGDWVERVAEDLPELPYAKYQRFTNQYGLNSYNAWRLTADQAVGDYFEEAAKAAPAQTVANWMLGDLFSLVNQNAAGEQTGSFQEIKVTPAALAELINMVAAGEINQSSGKQVLTELFAHGGQPAAIAQSRGLKQVSDQSFISDLVMQTLSENPREVASYRAGKAGVANFLFGQVMKKAAGQANPQVVRAELERQLSQ